MACKIATTKATFKGLVAPRVWPVKDRVEELYGRKVLSARGLMPLPVSFWPKKG